MSLGAKSVVKKPSMASWQPTPALSPLRVAAAAGRLSGAELVLSSASAGEVAWAEV